MKKSRKKIFLIVLMSLLLIIAIVFINFLPILSMKPVDTGEVSGTDVIAIKNNSNNLFLIETDDGYIVIDAGSDADKVEKSLGEMSVDIKQIRYVFLTHTDYDHVAAISSFTDAQIFVSEDELQMLDGNTKRNLFSRNSLPSEINMSSLVLLSDEQEIDLGGHIMQCIETPGHTPGSMSFLLDEKYLFTGDAVMVKNNTMGVHPFTMDKETAESSMKRIDEILDRSQFIFTAHYGYYEADKMK